MSDVVKFLEALARNPMPMSYDEYVALVANANLDPSIRTALLERDVNALNRHLQGKPAMFCVIFPADNDEPARDDQPADGDEVPDQDTSALAA